MQRPCREAGAVYRHVDQQRAGPGAVIRAGRRDRATAGLMVYPRVRRRARAGAGGQVLGRSRETGRPRVGGCSVSRPGVATGKGPVGAGWRPAGRGEPASSGGARYRGSALADWAGRRRETGRAKCWCSGGGRGGRAGAGWVGSRKRRRLRVALVYLGVREGIRWWV